MRRKIDKEQPDYNKLYQDIINLGEFSIQKVRAIFYITIAKILRDLDEPIIEKLTVLAKNGWIK